jgi:hypothetical protein
MHPPTTTNPERADALTLEALIGRLEALRSRHGGWLTVVLAEGDPVVHAVYSHRFDAVLLKNCEEADGEEQAPLANGRGGNVLLKNREAAGGEAA